jgi:D-3-phosphoglycerate dehydrogenase
MVPEKQTMKVLVADKLAEEGLEVLRTAGASFDIKVGLKEDELADAVANGGYAALILRSGAKVTAKVLEKPGALRAIARAGVGVDNINVDVATSKGVLVLNTAEASTLSTAEHAIALLMSLARKIPQAHAHVRSGGWKRNDYQGTQLAGKTAGVVGVGRIGRTVASRLMALDMNVVGFDPYVAESTVMDGKIKLVRDFDEFLRQIDVITFHVPGGEGTRHLLNRDRLFNVARKSLLVVNDARGEVLDEIALADALRERRIAGAAIDVYATEPPAKDHPLFSLDNVVLTPHLGASTDEAQTAVSVEACRAIVAYLSKGEIRGAVNAGGLRLDLPPDERPFADLAARMGALLSGLCDGLDGGGAIKSVTVRASGTKAPKLLKTLVRLATVELLRPHVEAGINLINVELQANARGIDLITVHEPSPPQGMVGDIVSIRVEMQGGGGSGGGHRILGTVYADGLPRVLRIDGFAMDMVPEGQMVLIVNRDQPGVIGLVGTSFGDAGVNIADMVISRDFAPDGSATAVMVLKVDSAPPEALVNRLKARPNILRVKSMVLPPRGK